MNSIVVLVVNNSKAGKRTDAISVWKKYMPEAIVSNPNHLEYKLLIDNLNEDIYAGFQVYSNKAAASEFLSQDAYSNYVKEVEVFLTGPPIVTSYSIEWQKSV